MRVSERARRTGLPAIGLVLCLLAVALAGTAPASAHAALASSSPEDREVLTALPGRVVFTFTEDVAQPAYVVVRAADGSSVTSGKPSADGATVTQALDGSAATGRFTMAYRVVSVDGHPVTGELSFTVAEPRDAGGARGAVDREEPAEEATSDAAATTAAEPDDGLWGGHGTHYLVGGFLVTVAAGLLLVSRGRSG